MVGVPANQTVVLCGLKADVSKKDLEHAFKDAGVMPECLGSEGITKVIKDKKDSSDVDQRRLVFINCKSKDAAKKVCAALHHKKSPLGMQKVCARRYVRSASARQTVQNATTRCREQPCRSEASTW